ncbi:RskA family anti-sigma factor [Nocardia thraciensis]
MNESQIDLAHAVALGSIGDEDQRAVQQLLDSGDDRLRADFNREVQLTREALTVFSSASAEPPPASLRDRLLAAIAEDQAPAAAARHPHRVTRNHDGTDSTAHL